jgi:3'-phosphoadenosine 5'-phosphosulfate sulfotransferase (PAPS reductase)/FAD synthetase
LIDLTPNYDEVFKRHENVALQFSGGKDSLACLYLMKPYWEALTVYYVNSGDTFPETAGLMETVRKMVPDFVEVQGRQPKVHRDFGWPSDIVPCGSTSFGRMMDSKEVALTDRYTCCFESIMKPMYEQMKADGITLIIRGQKNDDHLKPPLRSGALADGFEFLYPIETWSVGQLFTYLAEHGYVPKYYREGLMSAPDCLHCTAWLDEGRSAYLQQHHPIQFHEQQRRLAAIAGTLAPYLTNLHHEIKDSK